MTKVINVDFLFPRTVVNGILAQVASNLKTSCEVTDEAISKRLDEVKEAKHKLEQQKSETIVKIQEVGNIFLGSHSNHFARLRTPFVHWSKQ